MRFASMTDRTLTTTSVTKKIAIFVLQKFQIRGIFDHLLKKGRPHWQKSKIKR